MSWRTLIERRDFARSLDFVLVRDRDDGRIDVVDPFVVRVTERHDALNATAVGHVIDTRGLLQSIVDACWEFGIRPAGAKDSASELKATLYHLEDMRRLAFEARDVPRVELRGASSIADDIERRWPKRED
jgi:hypothetical protein